MALRQLLSLAVTQWRRLTVATLFLVVGSAMGLVYPQAVRWIIDSALSGAGGHEVVNRAALFMVGIFALEGVAVGMRIYLFSTVGERIVADLRRRLYEAVLAQEIAFFDRTKTGELTSRLSSDTTVLQSAVSSQVSASLRHGLTVVGGLAFLFYTSPRLAAIMLALVPAIALSSVNVGRRIQRLARKVQDAIAEAGHVAEESIAGVRTVRSFGAEAQEAARYGAAVEKSYELARRRSRANAVFMGTMTFVGFGGFALVLWMGGGLVVDGRMTIGDLTSFLMYTLTVAFALGYLGDVWAELMRASGAAGRVFELIERTPAMPTKGGRTLPRVEGAVRLRAVDFVYPSRPDVDVLRAVDIAIAPGEAVALVGPSGAGKSTIAALVGRLYDPQQGSVEIDGVDLRELDATWLRHQIGVVAQEPMLFSGTIADNIRYGRAGATDAEVEAAARAANAHDFIARFPDGYATLVGERGVQLSGGQKQRVAIARAVLKDPRILILDEATSALDAESEHLVKEATARLMKGRTTLIIAHRLSTVRDADRVHVLDAGRVVQTGDHAALMAEEGVYRRLVGRQLLSA